VLPKKLHLVGIRLSFYGILIGIRVMYHMRQYIKLSSNGLVVNSILARPNARVTNPQIERTEDTAIITITPGSTRLS
jgi:hypothetical protein